MAEYLNPKNSKEENATYVRQKKRGDTNWNAEVS